MEKELQKLVNLFSNKFITIIYCESKKCDFIVNVKVPIRLDPDLNYKIGLIWLTCYNTIYNITNENNSYTIDNVVKKFEPGAHEISNINKLFGGDNKSEKLLPDQKIGVFVDVSTSKCIMKIKEGSVLKFDEKSFFHTILGFKKGEYKSGEHKSDNIIQITNITSMNVECDIVDGSYINGEKTNILYSWPSFTVDIGYKFLEKPNPITYLPVIRKLIDSIHIRIIDNNGNLINFNGETISINLELTQV